MQDGFHRDAGVREKMAKEGPVGLVALGALRRSDEIERALERRCGQQIIIDIGNDGELEMARETLERGGHIIIEVEAGKGVEVAGDAIGVAIDSKRREGGGQTFTADLMVSPV